MMHESKIPLWLGAAQHSLALERVNGSDWCDCHFETQLGVCWAMVLSKTATFKWVSSHEISTTGKSLGVSKEAQAQGRRRHRHAEALDSMTILSFAYNVDTPSNPWAVLENFEMDQKL
jgi:hypothetical protein